MMANKQREKGVTAITVRGFKSIYDEQEIEIRPLTILAGANSSGKTSMMQPLLLLKQTLEAPYDPGPLLLSGPNVRFTSADQLLSRISGRAEPKQFSVGLRCFGGWDAQLVFSQGGRDPLDVIEARYSGERPEASGTLRPGMTREQIIQNIPMASEFRDFVSRRKGKLAISRNRCFLSLTMEGTGIPIGAQFDLLSVYHEVGDMVRGLIHLPGLRGNPERKYPLSSTGPDFPGVFQDYVAAIVAHWRSPKDKRLGLLGQALRTVGLTWKVAASPVDDTSVEIRVGRLREPVQGGARDLVNIADAGFGVSQMLPVALALVAAEPGQMVYLEQPEIHLHPRAQMRMAELLKDAAERGVRVVAETHSALLLLGVRTLVAEGKLDPNLVKLHWFTREPDGATKIDSVDLDEKGAFGDWPEDFGDIELEAESRYLEAVGR